MDMLWAEPGRELTGRDVAEALDEYAYTTVATVLDRLTHKGLVRRRREGRIIRFVATDTGAAHTAVAMHQALDASDDPDGALVVFAETASSSQRAALRRALARRYRRS
jgi:predicted transcriptional regulator